MYLIVSIVLLILLIPQAYYWIKERKYKSLGMSTKFFKRSTVYKEDNYEELYLTNTDGFDLFVRILSCNNPKGIVHIVHGVAEHSGNYMDFAKYTEQAFEISPSILQVLQQEPEPEPIVVPAPKPKPKPAPKPVVSKKEILNGSFSLPLWKKDGNMEVTFKNNCYETKEDYAYPTMFQLYMTNKKPCYVYAFASDSSSSKTNLLFPPENTSSLLDYSENTVVYPSEKQAIKLDDVSGTDYMIVLYSLEELDINQIMTDYEDFVENSFQNFDLYTAVKNAIGEKRIVSLKDTEYSKSSINFSVKMEAPTTNKVLPIIIKIKHR